MLRLSLRGFAARKLRVGLTVFAVALGVALISGTYVLTDTINRSFDSIFQTAAEGTDVSITARDAVETDGDVPSTSLDASLLERVEGVEGVERAAGSVETAGALFAGGERIGGAGAPTMIFSASPEPFDPLDYTAGRPPGAAREVALLESTAAEHDIALGSTVRVVGDGPARDMRVVGLARFGGVASFGGAVVVTTTLAEAQDLAGLSGRLTSIAVAGADGVAPAELRDAVRAVAPASADVRTGEAQADRQSADIREELGFLRTALLAFAGIALFVGGFIIFNTFSITVAQRMREFALLRTLGASRRQVMRQVLLEGLVIGVLGSLAGLLLGLALAPALRALFKAVGADLPSSGSVVEPRTIVVSLTVGTVVTVLSGLAPAIRSTQVPPVAALREGAVLPRHRGSRLVTPAGALLAAAGTALLAVGLFGGGSVSLVGAGAVAVFLGVALLSPRLVPPLAAALGRPLPGIVGRLARENVVRHPGRTAVTASALMIGVTLVAFVSIFAAGAKATIEDTIETAVRPGTLIVQNTDGFTPVPEAVAAGVGEVPGVERVSAIKYTSGRVDGVPGDVSVAGVDPGTLPAVFDTDSAEGSEAALGALEDDGVVLQKDFAAEHGLAAGDTLRILTPTRERLELTVAGTVDDATDLFGDLTVSTAVARRDFGERQDAGVFLATDPGSTAAAQRRIDELLERTHPIAETFTVEEFNDAQAGQIDQLLALIYVLLSLAVIVSLFGIVNTLVLSIFERTRELGMLRAIGTSRRQVRRMVRYEAIITSLIGAVIGVVLGVVFALAIAQPLEDDGFRLEIPVAQLAVLLALGALAGILAAVLPARRAARLRVLDALAYE